MKIQILIYDGFDELDAIGPFEVLRVAARSGADIQAELVTLDGAEDVLAQNGLRVGTPAPFDESADLLLVPGGGWAARAPRGAWAEYQRGTVPQALATWYASGKPLAAVCTGAMLIAATDALRGRHAITHHSAINDLREAGAQVIHARVVDDGDIITAGGVTSGIDLALWLVERYCGSNTALLVEQTLEYQRRGIVWRNPKEA
jgi:transcriptional regulator GlxA family with amidase domain